MKIFTNFGLGVVKDNLDNESGDKEEVATVLNEFKAIFDKVVFIKTFEVDWNPLNILFLYIKSLWNVFIKWIEIKN